MKIDEAGDLLAWLESLGPPRPRPDAATIAKATALLEGMPDDELAGLADGGHPLAIQVQRARQFKEWFHKSIKYRPEGEVMLTKVQLEKITGRSARSLALVFTVVNRDGQACAMVNMPRHAAILVHALGSGALVLYDGSKWTNQYGAPGSERMRVAQAMASEVNYLAWRSREGATVDEIAQGIVDRVYEITDQLKKGSPDAND